MVGKPASGDSRVRGKRRAPAKAEPQKAVRSRANQADTSTARNRVPMSATTEQLLERYRLRRSRAILNEVVERHRSVVESMAYTLVTKLPRNVDVQDLAHAGMWGLLQAVSSFEPERCSSFEAFMRQRVRGAMLDELRHMDFLPRLFRRRVRERDAASARLRMELEREPTNSELADELGISEDALLRCPESKVIRSVHWREHESGEDHFEHLPDEAIESPIDVITRQELLELVRKNLEPIEWKVLKLHYLDGLTGREVARRLRLSASRICQIHVAVLDRLKQQLTTAAV
ncbi:MAG TPA: sigma-70 family RNA polymerase sigma factor [Planctomycetes bacterium]|nr:sigma-70 family RNA polymerase sigma factor [Planctomycetota bacterium]